MAEKHVSPEFWAGLFDQGLRRDLLCAIALDIPAFEVFEAVAHRKITARYGAELLVARREAERAAEPWFIRLLRWLWAC